MTAEELSERFFGNVKKLNEMIGEKGIPVVFMANIPAAQSNEEDGKEYWRIIHMCDINDIYKKASRELGIEVISLYDLFTQYCIDNNFVVDSLLCDGLHPNDEGYKVMFDLLVKAMDV
jgi:lysophospholipase L1-like esterase